MGGGPEALVESCPLPPGSLLDQCRSGGAYADCYVAEVGGTLSLAQFIAAFYTTWVFRLERVILRWLASRPSTDSEARMLASGEIDAFAAWRVEDRREHEILLADFTGRTRSWLKTEPTPGAGSGTGGKDPRTRLYFGSAVIPVRDAATGRPALGRRFSALLAFHKLYSRILLRAACARLAGSKHWPAAASGPKL